MTHPTHPRLDCPSPICAPLPRRVRRPTANEIHEQRSRELYEEARAEFGVPGDETLAKRAADQVSLRDDKISQRELRRRVKVNRRRARRSLLRGWDWLNVGTWACVVIFCAAFWGLVLWAFLS